MPQCTDTFKRISTPEVLARLTSFDTTSRNSNLALIGFVRAYLDEHAIPYRICTDRSGAKANLHAVIGPSAPGGLALAGHVDTVPVDGQTWLSDPFELRRAHGRLYARGAADMKGFVAACLAAAPTLQASGLLRPLHLFITCDEETTCDGARRLIEDLSESGLKPALCVVGEPSLMKPILAHKGRLWLEVNVRGRPGHSSEPAGGVNAIHAAAEAISWVAAEARRFARQGPFEAGFDPPHTTVHVGTVEGGTVLNIIPERARFTMEWRTIPRDDFFRELDRMKAHVAKAIEPGMKAADPATGVTFGEPATIPGLSLSPDHELALIVKQITGANEAGKVSYGTEGGLYEAAGIPTIICGPGSIEQAHKPDEFVAVEQLALCDAFIGRLAGRLLT